MSVGTRDAEGNTPLHISAKAGHVDLILYFIEKGMPIDIVLFYTSFMSLHIPSHLIPSSAFLAYSYHSGERIRTYPSHDCCFLWAHSCMQCHLEIRYKCVLFSIEGIQNSNKNKSKNKRITTATLTHIIY